MGQGRWMMMGGGGRYRIRGKGGSSLMLDRSH